MDDADELPGTDGCIRRCLRNDLTPFEIDRWWWRFPLGFRPMLNGSFLPR
jgi:hypothetical protein